MMMILGNTIAMGVRERTREYGVLRALGFVPRHIRLFVIGEAVALGLVVGGLGILLAHPIVELGMGRFLEENMGAWFPYFRVDGKTYAGGLRLRRSRWRCWLRSSRRCAPAAWRSPTRSGG